jgi:phage terminase large subunit-like protein
MAEVGKPLLPWQREMCRDMLGRRADGKWSSYETGLFVARQNGKGVVIEARELYSLFILRTRRIIHSAHLFDTSREAFERLMEIIDGSDWLTKRVDKVNKAHGKEGITLTRALGGGQLKYKARTLHGARGFSGEDIVLDEAYALVAGHMSAISPILATLPNPSIGYFSSPPDDKTGPMPEDSFLPSVRKRGVAGDPRMTYWEFSPDEGEDPEDREVWYRTNPSLGYLIQEEYLADQLRIFNGAGKLANFRTEHLGAWPADADQQWQVIGETEWADALDEHSAAVDPVAFAVDVTPDRQWCSIAIAGRRADGLLHVELVDHRAGTGWVVERVKTLVGRWRPCAVVIDAAGPAGSLIADLEAAGVEVVQPSAREAAQACGSFYDAVSGVAEHAGEAVDERGRPTVRCLRHRSDPSLTAAVAGATKRPLGSAWAWDRMAASVDISPLVAVTLAAWAHATRAHLGATVLSGSLMA